MKEKGTREAFLEMISQKKIYTTLGFHRSTLAAMKIRIDKGTWPTIDKMEELLLKAGYEVVQEKLWSTAKL